MKLLDQVKRKKGLTNYGVAKTLRSMGVEITTQGVDQYDKGKARSMRLDVLVGLKRILEQDWSAVGKLLEEEFGGK